MVATFIIIILVSLISAVLAIQVSQESTLILRVKQFLSLEQPYDRKLLALSKFRTWWSLIPRWFVVGLPIISVIVLVLRLHHFLSDLLSCPYCSSFHFMWLLLFLVVGFPFVASIVLAPLAILGVYIIEGIRK